MADYHIQGPTRRCVITGRELRPGERAFTVLIDQEGRFIRQDYSTEAWQGPPSNAFGFWQGKVPTPEGPRRPPIDDEMLLECLRRLEGQEDGPRGPFRYVVALLLLRRKRLKFESARTVNGQEILKLRCARSRQVFEVANPGLDEAALDTVQDEVFKVLGWD
jgi:hypothetical protein